MSQNLFIEATKYNQYTFTENGALTMASTGSELANQFGLAGNYRGRNVSDVFSDQEKLWNESHEYATRFPFYLRMITRKVKVNNETTTDNIQSGQGQRDETFKRLLWLAKYHKDTFNNNVWILPVIGSWKDLWTIMYYDEHLDINAIDREVIYRIIYEGLKCDMHVNLVKKFMPRIKSKSHIKTDWNKLTNKYAKEFAKLFSLSYKEYNHLKTSGTSHDFQKLMCSKNYDKINWNTIPGRALSIITNGKFLGNHNLVDSYTEWVLKQDNIKFTGYPYELIKNLKKHCYVYYNRKDNISVLPKYVTATINKQFNELIEKGKNIGGINGNVWCALDTSCSMNTGVHGDTTALDICLSLGLYFSTLNTGAFHKNVIMFDDTSRVLQLNGEFCDMLKQIPDNAMGGTNFQSVVDEIVRIRTKHPEIPLTDYPQTLLVVSDMQFNATNNYWQSSTDVENTTNYEEAKKKLKSVFPEEFVDDFRFIWWNCASRHTDFPATIKDGGCYFLSGFDGSIISLLLGGEEVDTNTGEKKKLSMEELMHKALTQEILNYIVVE